MIIALQCLPLKYPVMKEFSTFTPSLVVKVVPAAKEQLLDLLSILQKSHSISALIAGSARWRFREILQK